MTTFTKISDLPTTSNLSDNDKFIVETSTGTKACSRSALREAVEITKADIGLGNVDNTSDLAKPISNAMASALLGKVSTTDLATALDDFLTKVDAASTYLAQNTASGTYLTKTDAATYYITQESAGSVYATKTEAANNITTNTFTVLATTTKTVTGAINELNTLVSGVETLLSQI